MSHFLCCQVPVPAASDVFQQKYKSDREVDLRAEQQQQPPQPEERNNLSPLCEPTAKGCRSDPSQTVSVYQLHPLEVQLHHLTALLSGSLKSKLWMSLFGRDVTSWSVHTDMIVGIQVLMSETHNSI